MSQGSPAHQVHACAAALDLEDARGVLRGGDDAGRRETATGSERGARAGAPSSHMRNRRLAEVAHADDPIVSDHLVSLIMT